MMPCGNKADWNVPACRTGNGEADCDFAGNLYRHHINSFRDLVVAREVGGCWISSDGKRRSIFGRQGIEVLLFR